MSRAAAGAFIPEARKALPSKPGEANPRHEVCIKMGRRAQDWERMTPGGAGEVGRRGPRQEEPLFPGLCPLGHPARAGPVLACPSCL